MQSSNDKLITSELSSLVQNTTATIFRYKFLIVGIFALATLYGVIFAKSLPNRYTAVSTLLIEDNSINLVTDQRANSTGRQDELELQTQRELLLSRDLSKKVIKRVRASIGETTYIRSLNVTGGVRSKILNVTFESTDPKFAALIVNDHVDAYMDTEIEARRQQIETVRAKADQTIEDLKETRAQKSQLAQNLRQDNNLVKGMNSGELIYEQISSISSQIPPIEAKKYALQSKLDALHATNNRELVSDMVDSFLIQQLKVEENKRLQEYKLLQSDLGEKNPDLIAARQAYQATGRAINSEIGNVKDSLENEWRELQRQEDELNARLKELSHRANFQQGKMIKLEELELAEAASQKLLDGLLERYEEVQSQANFLEPKARIISRASVPQRHSGPNRKLIVVLSILFAGVLSTLIILFLELQRSGLKNFTDVRDITGQNPLGILPKFPKNMPFGQFFDTPSHLEAMRRVVLEGVSPLKGGSLLVTSPQSGEGRSLFTGVLAQYLAGSGNRVLVLELDAHGSGMPFKTDQGAEVNGLHDLLRDQASIDESVQNVAKNFDFIAHGNADLRSSELLILDKFSQLLGIFQTHYDYVLIDAAPVLAHGGVEVIAAKTSGVIMVAQWLKTKPEALNHAMRLLNDADVKMKGVVLNVVDIASYKRMNPDADFLLSRGGRKKSTAQSKA